MFEDEEWVKIIYKLVALTKAEKIKWEFEYDGSLNAMLDGTLYKVGSVDIDGRAPYYFSISDGNPPVELARVESGPGNEYETTPGEGVTELQRMAYRMASGGPQLAAKLLAQMEAILPTPSKDSWGNDTVPF